MTEPYKDAIKTLNDLYDKMFDRNVSDSELRTYISFHTEDICRAFGRAEFSLSKMEEVLMTLAKWHVTMEANLMKKEIPDDI